MNKTHSNNERGNVLFLILIAVALFAALSYAVTQSGRGGGTIDRESASIGSGQVTQYSSLVRAAVTRMVYSGTGVSMIDLTTPTTGQTTQVFDPAGGSTTLLPPPPNIGSAFGGPMGTTISTWGFKDARDPSLGYYILGVGTDTVLSGREIIAFLHDIAASTCQQILKGLALNPVPVTQAVAVDYTSNGGKGLATGAVDGNANTYSALPGQAYACIKNGATGTLDFYHALVEQ